MSTRTGHSLLQLLQARQRSSASLTASLRQPPSSESLRSISNSSRARLAVPVLARQRAAVGGDQVGRILHERAVVRDALRREEVPVEPGVQAAVADVAEHARDAAAVPLAQRLQVAEVRAGVLRRDGG